MKTVDVPQKASFFDMGLDRFGQSRIDFTESEQNKIFQTHRESGIASTNILGGSMITDIDIRGKFTVSDEFNTRVLIGKALNLF